MTKKAKKAVKAKSSPVKKAKSGSVYTEEFKFHLKPSQKLKLKEAAKKAKLPIAQFIRLKLGL